MYKTRESQGCAGSTRSSHHLKNVRLSQQVREENKGTKQRNQHKDQAYQDANSNISFFCKECGYQTSHDETTKEIMGKGIMPDAEEAEVKVTYQDNYQSYH